MSVQEIWGYRHSLLKGGRGSEVRFRPERYDGRGLPFRARVAGQSFALADFSRGGLGVFCQPSEVPAMGSELKLEIELQGEIHFCARAGVVHSTPSVGGLVVGMAFLDRTLDVDHLFAVHAAVQTAQKLIADLQNELSSAAALPAELRALVADMRLVLEAWRNKLDGLEAQSANAPASRGLGKQGSRALLDRLEVGFVPGFLDFVRRFDALTCELAPESQAACRDFCKAHLLDLLSLAPVHRRAYQKPLGYAGDYLVMHYFYIDHDLGDSLFARLLHRASCQVTAARAVSSRVGYLKEKVRQARQRWAGSRLRVLSIGCGAAQEVQELVAEEPQAAMSFSLVDQDSQALDHCQRRLSALLREPGPDGPEVHYYRLSVLQLLRGRAPLDALAGQHLIYAAGLFDYLESDVAQRLLVALLALLAPGGRLIVGNFDFSCDTRGIMKYLLDWDIIYRSRDDMLDLVPEPVSLQRHVEAESTGINLFLVLDKE